MQQLSSGMLQRPSLSTYQAMPKTKISFVLDNIRSAYNVGSFFRIADAFLIQHLYLCGISAPGNHPSVCKTALGAEVSVAWSYHPHTDELLTALQTNGYTIIAIELTNKSMALTDFVPDITQPYAFVFGHEVHGVSQAALDLSEGALAIAQHGTKHSLNVASVASIVSFRLSQYWLA